MKFVLYVEGETEQKVLPGFLKRWLDPQLNQPVGIDVVRSEGWPEYKKKIAKRVALKLSSPSNQDVIACIGLLDLYGPTFYPPDKKSASERLAWARKHFEDEVNNKRFSQHFAVHELEAWLLAQPTIFPTDVKKALPGKAPESVNFDQPPAKLLEKLYQEKMKQNYRKIMDGVSLFTELDPSIAYAKCPNFKKLLDDMLQKAWAAGLKPDTGKAPRAE